MLINPCCDMLCRVVSCCAAQDPSDKRYANCDATLQRLTGERRIMLFGAQKYFKNHLLTK